jgi:hypothetical protein
MELELIFERFLIQPYTLLAFIALYLINVSQKINIFFVSLLLIINVLANVMKNFAFVDYQNKRGIHEYILNSLSLVPNGGVLLLKGDTLGFGANYLQQVEKIRTDIKLIQQTWGNEWSVQKEIRKYPEIFKDDVIVNRPIYHSINFKVNDLYTNFPTNESMPEIAIGQKGTIYHYTLINKKLPIYECEHSYMISNRNSWSDFGRLETNTFFDNIYGECHLNSALFLMKSDLLEARVQLKKAISLSPFNARYQERLCFTLQKLKDPEYSACNARLDELLLKTHPQYYLHKYDI